MPSKANLGSFAKSHEEQILPDLDRKPEALPSPPIAPKPARTGRPPKPAKEKRRQVSIYLTSEQIAVIARKAGRIRHATYITDFLEEHGFFEEG